MISDVIEKTEIKSIHLISEMTPAQVTAARIRNLADHICLLESRYSTTESGEIVSILKNLLARRMEEATRVLQTK